MTTTSFLIREINGEKCYTIGMDVNKISNLTALPDKRAHSATLQPGETITLYGGITVTNNSKKAVSIEIIDHLVARDGMCGLYISIDGAEPKQIPINANVMVDPTPIVVQTLTECVSKLDQLQ
ncbi:MAG: hypothetical protein SP1CHLAM54_11100 [Chlamydiia bacterium]|nr:hypothetical protein [Chlamydiia bacterium]MCH9616013.1 hypothetical protein [Chlamydiia bacterium]MCH9629036.1 hypothetical protein [Chlamydiia bacterium]